jgi:hypothetical protein
MLNVKFPDFVPIMGKSTACNSQQRTISLIRFFLSTLYSKKENVECYDKGFIFATLHI